MSIRFCFSMINLTTKSYYGFIVLLIGFCSCQSSGNDAQQVTNTEKEKDSFRITFDTNQELNFHFTAKPEFSYAQVYKDSIDLLVCPNRQQHSIDFYRMDNGVKIDSVLLSLDGPNGIPRIDNFLYKKDTIYAVSTSTFELVLFNIEGETLKRMRIVSNEQNELVRPNAYFPVEVAKVGDLVYVSGDPELNVRDQKSYKTGKYAYEVNIKSEEFRSVFKIATVYHEDQWMINQYFYSNLYNPYVDKWLFSFQVDDSIRVYNTRGRVDAYFAGSSFSGSIKKWNKDDLNSEKAYSYYLKNKVYDRVIYDKKNRLYYRFVIHPNQDAIANRDINGMWKRRYSIVILNEDFLKVGETMVKDKAFGQDHISTNDGVYLSYYIEDEAVEGVKRYVKINPVKLIE